MGTGKIARISINEDVLEQLSSIQSQLKLLREDVGVVKTDVNNVNVKADRMMNMVRPLLDKFMK